MPHAVASIASAAARVRTPNGIALRENRSEERRRKPRSEWGRDLRERGVFSIHTTGDFAVDMCISKSRKP